MPQRKHIGKSGRRKDLDQIFIQVLNEPISVTQINSILLFTKLSLPGKIKRKQSPQTVPLKMPWHL